MRRIVSKGSGGYYLDQAHQNPPSTADQAISRWNSFRYKDILISNLLEEQYGLCCYSELRSDLEGLGYHVEHILLKSIFPEKTFDYSNMAASALSSNALSSNALKEIPPRDIFGGHAVKKQKAFDLSFFVSCRDDDCNKYFTYLSDGRVVPSIELNNYDKKKADYTIDVLNLNSPFLINRRRNWFDELGDLFEEHENKGWSIDYLAGIYLIPVNQKLDPFFSLTRQFFAQVAERVLKQAAPELV